MRARTRVTNQVFPNLAYNVSIFHKDGVTRGLTFSIPKNLSLPSSRNGPESNSIRSKGVGIGTAWSFFPADADVDELFAP